MGLLLCPLGTARRASDVAQWMGLRNQMEIDLMNSSELKAMGDPEDDEDEEEEKKSSDEDEDDEDDDEEEEEETWRVSGELRGDELRGDELR